MIVTVTTAAPLGFVGLGIMGGDAAVVERCMPVFKAIGRTFTHIGGNGAGRSRNFRASSARERDCGRERA